MTKTFLILHLLFLTFLSSGCDDYDRIALLMESISRLQVELEETQMELEQKKRELKEAQSGLVETQRELERKNREEEIAIQSLFAPSSK